MKIKDMTLIAVMAAIISICSWISVPAAVPFTMQTFGVFLTLLVLGGKRGTASIGLYILLGMVGIPVFSGFQGGIGHVIGPTGGYIIGFIFMGLIYILGETFTEKNHIEENHKEKNFVTKNGKLFLLIVGLLVCYLIGTLWFMAVGTSGKGFIATISMCVLPFVIPDLLKLLLAWRISIRVQKHIGKI